MLLLMKKSTRLMNKFISERGDGGYALCSSRYTFRIKREIYQVCRGCQVLKYIINQDYKCVSQVTKIDHLGQLI